MNHEPIPAATLILVRESEGRAPELLMVQRAEGMAFAAGAWVFPGGRIDEGDRDMSADAAAVAAIRETLEETAVAVGLLPVPDASKARELQQALIGDQPLAELLRTQRLELDLAALTPFARWLPKIHVSRRFDTMFFIARCPDAHWEPHVVEGECAAAAWMTAEEVIERDRKGDARLIFPTRRTLERLAQHGSFEAMRGDALAHPVEPITPSIEEVNGTQYITIADHLGFPVTREELDRVWRG